MQLYIFWFSIAVCCLVAYMFVLPPFWVSGSGAEISNRLKYSLSLGLVIFLPIVALSFYFNLGAAAKMQTYYSTVQVAQRNNIIQIRPLYAQLQRAMLKNNLNLNIDQDNLDLILNFATLHSKQFDGVLDPDVKSLLEGVLRSVPQQITALNLLAIHAYKTQAYAQSVGYWQQILQQFTPAMQGSVAEKLLQNKIAQAQLFESSQTK
jgi:hypothetical protein